MSRTRYGHSSVGGGHQDQAERKDRDWTSRQGGDQSAGRGRRGEARPAHPGPGHERPTAPPQGTNTQGELAGIGEASEESADRLRRQPDAGTSPDAGVRERDARGAGTDQPPRMGGPLGPDPDHPNLPEGAQNPDTQGTGAGGFDRGVNATTVGAVHQGAREEDVR